MLTKLIAVLRERGIRGLLAAMVRRVQRTDLPANHHVSINDVSRLDGGVDALGFFTAEHGVGYAARALVATLETKGISTSIINYTDTESRTNQPFRIDDESRHRVLICSINAEQMTASRTRLPRRFYEDRYIIGQWFWELEVCPPWYQDAWPMVNELWAPTRFIETMLRASAPENVHVHYVPLPIQEPEVSKHIDRSHFNLDGRHLFLFVFDLMSIMKRKNPLGLIDAYTRAFPVSDGAQLVIKTMNGDKRPEDLALLRKAASTRTDITIIDEYFSHVETSTLISLADCYVSLHRSEGLGLTLAEAMSHAVPVIATNYSGNTDFMTEHNSFPIGWDRVAVGEGAGGYDSSATWAEPRIDEAAAAMRFVFENPSRAKDRAARGRDDVLGGFSVEASGAIMKARLEEIWREQRDD